MLTWLLHLGEEFWDSEKRKTSFLIAFNMFLMFFSFEKEHNFILKTNPQ